MDEITSCSSLKPIAPRMPPYSQPTPPITRISITSAERWNSNKSSDAKPVVCVSSAPAAPASAAANVYTCASLAVTGMPMAMARSRLSRMALSVAPKGDCTMRRASKKNTSSTVSEYQAAVRPYRSNSNLPSTGPIITPCRPSAPPVSQSSLLASSSITRPTPSVTMRRVRSVPRMMVSDATAPSTVAAPMPTARPTSGSGITCLANSAAA